MGEDIGFRVRKDGPVARITLARPDKHNAFDDELIRGLTGAFTLVGADEGVRAVVLAAEGASFSAGADLGWMRRMAGYSQAENEADALALAELMRVIDICPKPVIALVQGASYGGGVGLVACADIAIALPSAKFCLSEVKLGLIPAVISPYVVRAMGARAARRWFLTAEVFGAEAALAMGLVHQLVPDDAALEAEAARLCALIAANGPRAVAASKALVAAVDRPFDDAVMLDTARRIAAIRASDEGREGIQAFLDKRKPGWTGGDTA